jgi:DNA-binding transcriptional ArsR family regulator
VHGGERSRGPSPDVDVRVVKALNHPTRVSILALLRRRELVSPVEVATELGLPLGTVGYHVRRLEQLGFIELAKQTRRRGAIEHHYRARPRLDAPRMASHPPSTGPDALAVQLVDDAQAALGQGGFDALAALAEQRVVTVDRRGCAQLHAELTRWQEAIRRIERGSERRLGADRAGAHACTAVVLLFDIAPGNGNGNGAGTS